MEHDITAAAQLIRQADGLLIGAGAGMGVDSGLPDFRGNTGFWKAYPFLGKARIPFIQIADPAAFANNPQLAWGFYGHRLQLYRDTLPHKGFQILKEFAASMTYGSFVFTSNVDGQFQKAGFLPETLLECHGSIHYLQCTAPCSHAIWSADNVSVVIDRENCRWEAKLPLCPECGALARPNILMFNDWAWVSDRTDLQSGRFNQWRQTVRHPVVIEIGAGLAIPVVRRFCESAGAPLIRINPSDPVIHRENPRAVSLKLCGLKALEKIHAAWRLL